MQHLRNLIESRPMLDRVPAQDVLSEYGGNNDHLQATRGMDYILVYSAQGRNFSVNPSKISGKELIATWYNPRNGEITVGEKCSKNTKRFTPPTSGYGQDWILVIDDLSKNYSFPTASPSK